MNENVRYALACRDVIKWALIGSGTGSVEQSEPTLLRHDKLKHIGHL